MSMEFRDLADRIVNTKAEVEHLRTQLALKEREFKSLVEQMNDCVDDCVGAPNKSPVAPIRRQKLAPAIERLLVENDAMKVGEIAAALKVSSAAVYHHLGVLRKDGKLEKLEDNHWGLKFEYLQSLKNKAA